MRQAAKDLILFQFVGNRNLHSAIERQFTSVNAFEDLVSELHYIIALEELCPESASRNFNSFGKADFFIPRQQGNLAHLRQVHANRIIGPSFRLFFSGG
jgi:hypothetical protein